MRGEKDRVFWMIEAMGFKPFDIYTLSYPLFNELIEWKNELEKSKKKHRDEAMNEYKLQKEQEIARERVRREREARKHRRF